MKDETTKQHDPQKEHHIWCNYFMRPREGCKMCEGLYSSYPMDGDKTGEDLMREHFPKNIPLNPHIFPEGK